MSFRERRTIGEKVAKAVTKLFRRLGFKVVDIGYENIFPESIMKMLVTINDPTVHFIRFMPDKFVYFDENNIFLTEIKVCNTPIRLDSRVETLKSLSGIDTLTKENIGAIETSAMKNYKNLSSLGVKILIVVYSTFHGRPLVADWIDNVSIVHQDDVRLGHGNASRTPYTNINLDDFKDIRIPLIREFRIEQNAVGRAYKDCIKDMT